MITRSDRKLCRDRARVEGYEQTRTGQGSQLADSPEQVAPLLKRYVAPSRFLPFPVFYHRQKTITVCTKTSPPRLLRSTGVGRAVKRLTSAGEGLPSLSQ